MELLALAGLPLIAPGDDLARILASALTGAQPGDVLVLAQKIVSKAENRYRALADVQASPAACDWAAKVDKDPRLVQLILDESTEVLRWRRGAMIVRHRLGQVQANAGIDQSNIPAEPGNPRVLLLPVDPDASARRLREALSAACGFDLPVIIADSAGRPWRNGILGFAIGSAGIQPVVDKVGERDLFGRPLEITQVAVVDELACAASLLMGQAAEGLPAVLVRGARWQPADCGAGALIRAPEEDLFR